MKYFLPLILLYISNVGLSQTYTVKGIIAGDDGSPIIYGNTVLYASSDSSIVKAGTTDENGIFELQTTVPGEYFLIASYIGYQDLTIAEINLSENLLDLGSLTMTTASVQLEEAVVIARRAMVEIKPDRTVFNVQGTINSVGDNGLGLLRKAPGVLVDNNNNISVLSRSGVLVYVDGKRLPLTGDDLTNYLQNLAAEQIDRMDIITNPGAKYEAQGNAGIIDIRLKKDKNLGANGVINGTLGQGQLMTGNVGLSGNFRNKTMNTFGTLGFNGGDSFNEMVFDNFQNGLFMDESNYSQNNNQSYNFRWGTDFFISQNSTIGFLVSGTTQNGNNQSENIIEISNASPNSPIDSVLVADNASTNERDQMSFNVNYVYDNRNTTVNVDLDYGLFRNDAYNLQPNLYFDPNRTNLLTAIRNEYGTPVNIDIYTFKIDVENSVGKGKLGYGTKLSKVATDNTFLFFNEIGGNLLRNNRRSNQFLYDENVYAGYVSYNTTLSPKWSISGGIRMEITDARGDLIAFLPELQEPPIDLNYTNFFPSGGITYAMHPEHTLALNYGRRINRPDYNVLNPFEEQLSELSFSKGNPFLRPEIVNNIELGYTLKYRYNFKLSYSQTDDQITRLIGPDDRDPRAGFINWDNLATQKLYSFAITAPIDIKPWWNTFFNFNGGYLNNQADYGDGAVVDVQAWTYNIFQQSTFKLGNGFTGEISGWFSGPGVWGGVFKYDSSYSLNLGLQKRWDNLNARLSATDLTYQSGWSGVSEFNGLRGLGAGNWDSRRVSLSLSYSFGNNQVKRARNRKTGIEAEAGRAN